MAMRKTLFSLRYEKRQARPPEVIVLADEIALTGASFIVVDDDVLLGVFPVVGDDAAVDILLAEYPL